MSVALLTLHLRLSGCSSLKEKRSQIKPILARLHREFNVSTAEVDRQDVWQEAVLACATVSSDANQNHRLLMQTLHFVEVNWPEVEIFAHTIELL